MKFNLYSIRSFLKRLFSPCSWLGLLNASESHKPDNTGLGWRRNTLDHLTFLLWRTGGTAIDLNSHRKPSFFFFWIPGCLCARACMQETNSKQKNSNANLGFLQINGRCLSGLSIRDETNLRNTLFERGNCQFSIRAYSPSLVRHLSRFMPSVITNRQRPLESRAQASPISLDYPNQMQ